MSTGPDLVAAHADVLDRLLTAARTVLAQRGPKGLTIGRVAAAAGVRMATARAYFGGKEQLIAELNWRTACSQNSATGGIRVVPPGVQSEAVWLRARIGPELARRIDTALGPSGDSRVAALLEVLYAGALLDGGLGHAAYRGDDTALETFVLRILNR